MALVLSDRTLQTGTANTTVSFTLSGSVTGYQSFAVIGNGNTTYYSATDVSGSWEVGIGTYSTTGPTLTRTTILASSNSGSAVTFSGTVTVFVTYPAEKSANTNAALSSGRVTYATTNGLLTDSAGLTFDGTNFATTGTATATKLIPTGTSVTGNGMYLPATNSIGISTAGVNAVYIDASQNVGIGTSSPLDKLSVSTSTAGGVGGVISAANGAIATIGNEAVLAFRNASQFGTTYYSGKIRSVMTNATSFLSDLAFNVYDASGPNGLEAMRIQSSGNVGIGTSSPNGQLSFGLGVGNSGALKTYNNNDISGFSTYSITDGTRVSDLYAGGAPNGAAGGSIFRFLTTSITASTFPTERMRIDSSGNVGIGTSTTTNGNLTVQQASATTGGPVLTLWNSNGSAGNTCGYLKFYSNTTVRAQIHSVVDSGGPFYGNLIFSTGENTLTERARIDSSGNLLVGTTASAPTAPFAGGIVVAGTFRTIAVSGGVANAASATLFTITADSAYLVTAQTGNASGLSVTALVRYVSGGNPAAATILSIDNAGFTITMSGTSVQITNALGGPVNYTANATRIF